jgi:hypothetical protein
MSFIVEISMPRPPMPVADAEDCVMCRPALRADVAELARTGRADRLIGPEKLRS